MPGFQVKVVLEGTKPPLWRRLLLPDQLTFAKLHDILQIVFGWEEEHLHDFSFQNSRERIGDTEADMDEHEVAADEYLRAGWIRYTYDFGDSWEHKITLEKEVKDYGKRYPTLLTHKRNNMEEDSGGVWSGEESNEPYEEAAVNAVLKEICFCEPFWGEENPEGKKEEDLFTQLNQIIKNGSQKQLPKKKSNMERKLEKINSFYEEVDSLYNFEKPAEKRKETQTPEEGQLVFNFSTGEIDLEAELPDFCFCKQDGDITQAELLETGTEKSLTDYARYLMIPSKEGRSRKDTKEAILDLLQAHPEYYLIFMDEIMVQSYLLSMEKKTGEVFPFITQKSVVVLCTWGLWDVQIRKNQGKSSMEISVAKGAESLQQFLKTARLHQHYSSRKTISDGISYLMKSYGFMELSALHSKYQKAFGPAAYEELMRYLYLDGHFYGTYLTGECLIDNTITSFAAVDGLNPNWVLGQMGKFGQGLEYADFKNRQLLKWKEGIGSFVPAWEDLADTLVNLDVVFPEDLEVLLPELYLQTLSGFELNILLYIIEENFFEDPEEPHNMLMLTSVWISMVKCWLDTPLACLKGYSRTTLARRTGRDPFMIAVEEDMEPEELDGDEQIYELPLHMQQELYYLLADRSNKKNQKATAAGLQKIAKGVGRVMQIFEVLETMFALE